MKIKEVIEFLNKVDDKREFPYNELLPYEKICSFEISKTLREKGFDEKCRFAYLCSIVEGDKFYELTSMLDEWTLSFMSNREIKDYLEDIEESYVEDCCAPTLEQARQWFLDKKGYLITVRYFDDGSSYFGCTIDHLTPNKHIKHIYVEENDESDFVRDYGYSSYDEALTAGIKHALKLI